MYVFGWMGLAIVLFASTNLDDLFILLALFADPRLHRRHIAIGQYLGLGTLILVSLIASLVSLVIPMTYVGLLGLLPILFGVKKLFEWGKDQSADPSTRQPAFGRILMVAAVTVANGGDNISIYMLMFAQSSPLRTTTIILVFTLMIECWLLLAGWLVRHPRLGAPIRRFGSIATPFILIGLGLFILLKTHTYQLLAGH